MKDGLHVGIHNEYLERIVKKSTELRLLGRGDGSEVMLQNIRANETVFIQPSDGDETLEFFYILDGEIEMEDNDGISSLIKGDYFYTHDLKENVQFKTISDVTLLYLSTQPQFAYISTTMKDLTDLAKRVEDKDSYTFSHNVRVKDYGVKIGNRLKLSKEKNENLVFACLIHDIGKINIPDEILNKPGKLTNEEYDCIKKHPTDGANLVKETYYEKIAEIIDQHHERIDGSGYPNGLKGDEILIEAKIIAVSDTYDAMTTDRPYRKGLTPQASVDELRSLRGIHYDADIVDALVDILKEEGIIKED